MLGAAGHVLDFDDTYLPGIAHLSAVAAPAALALGAARGASVGQLLTAFAIGFEQAGALARASHPQVYERGWHPTALCGAVGAAAAGAQLLGLTGDARESALALAALRAAGGRAGFGSDAKSLGVGLAAADGVRCAQLAAGGARLALSSVHGARGFEQLTGGRWAIPQPGEPAAVLENWIKPWPCCLMAHSAIEAALGVREAGGFLGAGLLGARGVVVRVHPRARQAASFDDACDGLQARFSIPYLTAYALLEGAPDVAGLAQADERVRVFAARRVHVVEDASLGESEARIEHAGGELLACVEHAIGSPRRPLSGSQQAAKLRALAGSGLDGILDDERASAASVLAATGVLPA